MIEQDNANILSELPERSRNIISNFVATVLIFIILIIIYSGWKTIASRYAGVSGSVNIMGTVLEVKVSGMNMGERVKASLIKAKELDTRIDYYNDKSEISDVNNLAGISAVAVSHEIYDLLDNALILCRQTGGAFDITIGPLVDIWNFRGREHRTIPSGNELVYAQHLVNYNNVQMNSINETVKLMYPGMKIDVSSAEKGYIISKVRAMLVQKGVKNAKISAGGCLAVIGDNRGRPWKVSIKDPANSYKVIGRITIEAGQAVCTASDHDRYFELAGNRYHDILDPATGMPANGCRSVTIISDDATQADMLSKAVFIMGPKRGLDLLRMFKNVNAVIIGADGNVITTPGFALER